MGRAHKAVDTSTYSGRLAVRIRSLRIEAGLSVEDFAKRITKANYELSVTMAYKWEQNTHTPHSDAYPAIAKVLGVSVHELLPSR